MVSQIDIAIIGAGIAGVTAGQTLQQAGYRVVVVEKSRGVGGRMATRRLHNTRADHGTCYLSPQGAPFRALLTHLSQRGIIQPWTNRVYELVDGTLQAPPEHRRTSRYVAPEGMNAIAKYLATGLDIRFKQRAIGLEQTTHQSWKLLLEESGPDLAPGSEGTLEATAVLITVPAPQAVALLAPLAERDGMKELLASLGQVEFLPCIAVMAGYTEAQEQAWIGQYPDIRAIAPTNHPDLAWLGLDSSKRTGTAPPLFVMQSTAAFAQAALDTPELQPVGQSLLQSAADLLLPWLASPLWMQVHRWRYAFASQPWEAPYLAAHTALPLVCAGDWCGGNRVENALHSGLEAADYLNRQLDNRRFSASQFWAAIA
jgi:hypothetical protein